MGFRIAGGIVDSTEYLTDENCDPVEVEVASESERVHGNDLLRRSASIRITVTTVECHPRELGVHSAGFCT